MTPGPTVVIGFQSLGNKPCCTLPSWYPASRRTSLGNARMSSSDDPSHETGFSRTYEYIQFYMLRSRRRTRAGADGAWTARHRDTFGRGLLGDLVSGRGDG